MNQWPVTINLIITVMKNSLKLYQNNIQGSFSGYINVFKRGF